MKLGKITEARSWYRAARLAADDGCDVRLRARARVQEAMLPYYYGDPFEAVRLAAAALGMISGAYTPEATMAAAAAARAWARLGNVAAAEASLAQAQQLFDLTDDPNESGDAWGFPERRLLLYLSGALSHMGATSRAQSVQQHALRSCAESAGIFVLDPVLIQLDHAALVARTHADEGCGLAVQAIQSTADGHRTQILVTRAREVLAVAGDSARHLPHAQQLRQLATGRATINV